MYNLLDLRACQDEIIITPKISAAILDCENVLIAAVSRSGQLIYHNRAFMEAYKNHLSGVKGLNIQEVLPDLWYQIFTRKTNRSDDLFKVIDLREESSGHVLGYLLVSVKNKTVELTNLDLIEMLNAESDSRFADSYIGFYVADPKANTLKVNSAYEKIAFLPENDLVGRNLKELVEKGYFSQSVTLRVLEQLKRGNKNNITFFQKIITGQEVIVTGKPIFSTEGRLDYILTFVQNVFSVDRISRKLRELENKSCPVIVPGGSGILPLRTPIGDTAVDNFSIPGFDSMSIVVRDPLTYATMRQLSDAAKYDSPILLCGETGVGKDVLAHHIHKLRTQKTGIPFISINCSAIPADLLESELFGYEEGAFSGARAGGKPGLFEEANGGTLFLNEIGEMPLSLQAKLLTVLDEECVRRLGSSKAKKVKAKIICATNRNLLQCVEQGTFRSDLYYRINVLQINIPSLRERPRDILPLVHHFMIQLTRQYGVKKFLCADVQDILLAYSWPGNIRELRNLVERLVVFSATEQVVVGDLPPELLKKLPVRQPAEETDLENGITLKEAVMKFERQVIEQALVKYGTASAAATALGIDPTTLSRKLNRS